MGNEGRLAFLRIQLFTAMQQLEGDELAEFWHIIDDVQACKPPDALEKEASQ